MRLLALLLAVAPVLVASPVSAQGSAVVPLQRPPCGPPTEPEGPGPTGPAAASRAPCGFVDISSGPTGHPVEGARSLAAGPDGSVYAAGLFRTATSAGVVVSSVARWDGEKWQGVGTLLANSAGAVDALAVGVDGSVYAGGTFKTSDGAPANYVARWDGAQWRPLGTGTNNGVRALAVGPDGHLYAGGSFTTAGGASARGVARWDGSRWAPLGAGVAGEVLALAFGPGNALYVGGNFSAAGGAAANDVARWNGAAWSPVGLGTDGVVTALAVDRAGTLYAGGDFAFAGLANANNVARWNGAAWSPLGSGLNETSVNYSPVQSLALSPDGTLHAGGRFRAASPGGEDVRDLARWDGALWRPLGTGTNGSTQSLVFSVDGGLYVGGSFTAAGGVASHSVARWDGEVWGALASRSSSESCGLGVKGVKRSHVEVPALRPVLGHA